MQPGQNPGQIGPDVPPGREPVQNAYRDYRRLQHAKRLNGNPKRRVPRETVADRIGAVRALWDEVFKG